MSRYNEICTFLQNAGAQRLSETTRDNQRRELVDNICHEMYPPQYVFNFQNREVIQGVFTMQYNQNNGDVFLDAERTKKIVGIKHDKNQLVVENTKTTVDDVGFLQFNKNSIQCCVTACPTGGPDLIYPIWVHWRAGTGTLYDKTNKFEEGKLLYYVPLTTAKRWGGRKGVLKRDHHCWITVSCASSNRSTHVKCAVEKLRLIANKWFLVLVPM